MFERLARIHLNIIGDQGLVSVLHLVMGILHDKQRC